MWTLLYRDLWSPIWPNLAASVIWAAPVLRQHRRHRRHLMHISSELADLKQKWEA